jgi:hypothetical protein
VSREAVEARASAADALKALLCSKNMNREQMDDLIAEFIEELENAFVARVTEPKKWWGNGAR